MGKIAERFGQIRQAGKKALIPYITAGYPDLDVSEKIARAAIDAGADILEIGIPFSDPIADGPSIQHSSQSALDAGATPADCLDMAARVAAERPDVPVLIMTYVNLLLAVGLEVWLDRMKERGLAGLILPDLSLESYGRYASTFQAFPEIELVQLASVVSPKSRLDILAQKTRGFLYVVSVTGVTGAGQSFDLRLAERMATIRSLTDCPLAIGFGVDGPQSAATLAAMGDGVIVGSLLVEAIRSADAQDAPAVVATCLAELREGMDFKTFRK
ncbi:MAG: tryptophan synthase subunit alpha [Planctomycetota bacterium]|jgi:tryptophan synthase alpha chain|nr:tryptophan synthase subunit alpha [Planctomycetota bacterium]